MDTFDYAVVPVTAVKKLFLLPVEEREIILQKSPRLQAVQKLLRGGFRWVRTEGTLAIFEKSTCIYSYTVDAERYLGLTN